MPLVQQHAVQQYVYSHSLIPSLPHPHPFKSVSAFLIYERQVKFVQLVEEFLQQGDIQ